MATDSTRIDGRTAALFALAVALMVALVVAWRIEAEATTTPPEDVYRLTVVDEVGNPVTGATVSYAGETAGTDADGTIEVALRSPELAIVTATGMLADAVVIGDDPETTLQLWSEVGPGGERIVMHFAGDFMLGRRFVDPVTETTPVVADEESAAAVVENIAPLFALADLSSVNFESVLGTLSDDDAYPGKRYLLQSPPETITALERLGVDLVTLGNNHANDWLDAGLASTLRYLESAGIAHPGAGMTASEAAQPVLLAVGDTTVGIVSLSTVTGDYVNDNLPSQTAPVPAGIADRDRWQYETREFGFGAPDEAAYVPAAQRRPGEMWRVFDEMEDSLTEGDAADLWSDVVRVYPELQDWVARRGHGGAARFSRETVEDSVAAARTGGADLVIVQIHGGFQFAEVSSDYFGDATRAAVDAGADLVVGHHPHILQGFEIYKGTLIAYSLGNFVFDQEFLATHPSVVLRTVFEGTDLIDASLFPVILDEYRPVATGGDVASRILQRVNLASRQDAESLRLPDLRIGSTRTEAPVTAMVVADGARGRVVPVAASSQTTIALTSSTPVATGGELVLVDDRTDGLMLGTDIFGYGDLEDRQSDGVAEGGLEWSLPPESLAVDPGSPEGPWVVRLDRTSQHLREIVARTEARVSVPEHRWFDADGQPVDGEAGYSVRVWGKRVGAGIPFVRLIYYDFDDTDPTREPESRPVATIDVQLPLVNDGEWHELWVELPEVPASANTALVGIGLAPPDSQSGTVWIDGMQVIEWREATGIPNGTWVPVDYVAGSEYAERTLTVAPGA